MNYTYTTLLFIIAILLPNLGHSNCPDGRISNDLVALYGFSQGSGSIVYDISNYGVPEHLSIEDPDHVSWHAECGLTINSNTIIESYSNNSKVINAVKTTNEITVEAWVQPANLTQSGPSRIVTISKNTGERNVTLGQEGSAAVARLRTTGVDNNGRPDFTTNNNVLTTTLQHIVYTRNSAGQEYIYVNGTQVTSGTRTGDFSNWDSSHKLALVNEITENRSWLGTLYLVGIYNKALSAADVNTNYQAGYCCESDTENLASDWLYNCMEGTGTYVETKGMGIENSMPASMGFTDLNTVSQIVIDVIYKGGNPGSSVDLQAADGTTYTAFRERPEGTSSSVYLYRFTIAATSGVTYSESSNADDAQSMMAYIFREGGTQTTQLGKFINISGYRDVQTINFDIPTATQTRDIDIAIPISELTDDCRIINISATAGNVSETITVDGPNTSFGSCCMDIINLTLQDVAANTSSLTIEVESPTGSGCSNGQSYVLVGAISVDVECDLSALPVELDFFEATLQHNQSVKLNWQTASELNNDYFAIERSADAIRWETIAWQTGAGTSQAVNNYEWYDEKPLTGKSYYRLKQVDFDGLFEYSPVRVIEMEATATMKIDIYPIPASEVLYVEGVNSKEILTVQLFNTIGQANSIPFDAENERRLRLDLRGFTPGTYYLMLTKQNEQVSRKIVIK